MTGRQTAFAPVADLLRLYTELVTTQTGLTSKELFAKLEKNASVVASKRSKYLGYLLESGVSLRKIADPANPKDPSLERYTVDETNCLVGDHGLTPLQRGIVESVLSALEPAQEETVRETLRYKLVLLLADAADLSNDEPVAIPFRATGVSGANLSRIQRAIDSAKQISFSYLKPGAAEPEHRTVSPRGIVNVYGNQLLLAFDEIRVEVRSFKLSRIVGDIGSSQKSASEAALKVSVTDEVRKLEEHAEGNRVRVLLERGGAGEKFFLQLGLELTPYSDDFSLLDTQVLDTQDFADSLLPFGDSVRVLESDVLRAAVEVAHDAVLAGLSRAASELSGTMRVRDGRERRVDKRLAASELLALQLACLRYLYICGYEETTAAELGDIFSVDPEAVLSVLNTASFIDYPGGEIGRYLAEFDAELEDIHDSFRLRNIWPGLEGGALRLSATESNLFAHLMLDVAELGQEYRVAASELLETLGIGADILESKQQPVPVLLEKALQACTKGDAITIRHYSADDPSDLRDYAVFPEFLEKQNNRWLLYARFCNNGNLGTFRLDRIADVLSDVADEKRVSGKKKSKRSVPDSVEIVTKQKYVSALAPYNISWTHELDGWLRGAMVLWRKQSLIELLASYPGAVSVALPESVNTEMKDHFTRAKRAQTTTPELE